MANRSSRPTRRKRPAEETNRADDIYRLIKQCNPGTPVQLLKLRDRLPPGYQETYRSCLFRVVRHLGEEGVETGEAKEAPVR